MRKNGVSELSSCSAKFLRFQIPEMYMTSVRIDDGKTKIDFAGVASERFMPD